jgi:hypothetical protein
MLAIALIPEEGNGTTVITRSPHRRRVASSIANSSAARVLTEPSTHDDRLLNR